MAPKRRRAEDGPSVEEEVVLILFCWQLLLFGFTLWIATFYSSFSMPIQHAWFGNIPVSISLCVQTAWHFQPLWMFLTHSYLDIFLMAFSVFSSWQLHIFRACLLFENIYSILSPISSFKYKYNGIFLLATTNMLSSPLIFSCLCLMAFSVFRCWHFQ